MEKNSVADALRALSDTGGRSETARLKDVLDDVERALSAGISRDDVLKTLKDQGFKMTKSSFASALHRLRKKRQEAQEATKKQERVHGTNTPAIPAASPHVSTPNVNAHEVLPSGGKQSAEHILSAPPQSFSLKNLQKQGKA